jgi:hypothetical protein
MIEGNPDKYLKQIINESFKEAQRIKIPYKETKNIDQYTHQKRSSNWVLSLGEKLRHFYNAYPCNPNSEIRVFSKPDGNNRRDFGLNELLYDVLVCRVGMIPSRRRNITLYYIKEAIWQIESEFRSDSRESLKDFNKLVIGNAPNKLFIGPNVSSDSNEPYLDVLLSPAKKCQGNVYCALIPHPSKWEDAGCDKILLWKFDGKSWIVL